MSCPKRAWAWLTSRFTSSSKDKPSVDETADLETVPDIADTLQEPEVKPQIDTMGMYADIVYFETHRDELRTLIRNPAVRRDMQAFLGQVDIPDLVRHYSVEALEAVRVNGTAWDLTPDLQFALERAASAEWARRNATSGKDRTPQLMGERHV